MSKFTLCLDYYTILLNTKCEGDLFEKAAQLSMLSFSKSSDMRG